MNWTQLTQLPKNTIIKEYIVLPNGKDFRKTYKVEFVTEGKDIISLIWWDDDEQKGQSFLLSRSRFEQLSGNRTVTCVLPECLPEELFIL